MPPGAAYGAPPGAYGTPGGAYGAPGGAYGAPGGAYGAPGGYPAAQPYPAGPGMVGQAPPPSVAYPPAAAPYGAPGQQPFHGAYPGQGELNEWCTDDAGFRDAPFMGKNHSWLLCVAPWVKL